MVFWGIGNHHHLFGQVFAHWTYNNKILGLGLTLEHPGTRRKVDIIIHYSLFNIHIHLLIYPLAFCPEILSLSISISFIIIPFLLFSFNYSVFFWTLLDFILLVLPVLLTAYTAFPEYECRKGFALLPYVIHQESRYKYPWCCIKGNPRNTSAACPANPDIFATE